ncbi:hypothetical protein ABEB36_005558 [Hypothenemus hampei]|uniref:Uncharacterized protein n=1 Tax=Hypothenemus hampei TaxID=57062 RepID=A0ABD1EYN0_HYPHA
MLKHKSKPRKHDEIRCQKSHYTNVNKVGVVPSKNLELSLEVEVDDEVRSIIRNPDRCQSALLDVTVIKPRGLNDYTTNTQTLKSNQVKMLLGSMNLGDADKQILMEKLFGTEFTTKDSKKKDIENTSLSSKCKHSSAKYEKQSILTDKRNSTILYNNYQHQQAYERNYPALSKVQHIYTSPRTMDNIRTMFECQNKHKDEAGTHKVDQPCLCQNCAIVGILSDSQKKPFATETIPIPLEEKESRIRRPSRKKSVSFKHIEDLSSSSKSQDQCQAIFKLLSVRISELEKRILQQEQKAVPKDYFKKIITKLVNHLSKLTQYTTEERIATNSQRDRDRDRDLLAPHTKLKPSDKNKYYVNPVLVENTYKVQAEKDYEPKPCSSAEPSRGESIWKWGEDFLTTGKDLKDKVVVLLEDTLRNLRKTFEKTANQHDQDEIQTIVDELSQNLNRTVKVCSPRRKQDKEIGSRTTRSKNNIYLPSVPNNTRLKQNDEKSGKPSLIPRYKRKTGPDINVEYVNPRVKRWQVEESSGSFKIDSSDYDSHRETMTEVRKNRYRSEFKRVLENTKTADKFKLWQSIWNQALENRQTKADTVVIQIPDPKDNLRQKMIHLEYTIGELEKLLLNDHNNCQNSL